MNEKSGLDEGFTQIPNKVITEIFIKGLLSQTEIRIVFYIIRFSWGFHKGWTNKCTVQKIAKDTGMSRRLCSTTINQMIRENKLERFERRFKFNDDHQDWKEVLTNPDNKCSQNLTESVNKKEQLVLTNRNSQEPNNNGQITTLKNPKESIKERINKTERNIKERKTYITFNKQTFKFENIPEEKLEKWIEAFPSIDVEVKLKKMEDISRSVEEQLKKEVKENHMHQENVKKIINGAMCELNKEDYDILYELYFKNTPIHQLSKKLGISRSTIRYRKIKALEQLKSIILRLKTSKRREVSHKSIERI